MGNVFIKNLDPSIDDKALYDTFSTFGNIMSCVVKERNENVKVKNEETGEIEEKTVSKGYGFVHFETQQAADLAIAKMNGMLLNGKKVFVSHFMKKSERFNIRNSEKDFTNIFVKNLDPSTTTEELLELFGKFGKIQHGCAMTDEKGACRGFGFINFEKHEDAVRSLELNETEFKGKQLFVARHQSRSDRNAELRKQFENLKISNKFEGRNLYVKNLDENFDDEMLSQEFAKYGEITSAKIMRDDKGQSRGFGFVCFSNAEEATRALTDMNGKMVGSKPLYVALAQKREERRAQLEAQYRRGPMPMGGPMMPGFAPYPQAPFFPHPGHMARGNFAPQMMRPRWAGPPGHPGRGAPFPGQPMGAGPFPAAGGNMRGGRGGGRGGRGGKMRYNQNVRNQKPLEQNGVPHAEGHDAASVEAAAPEHQGLLTLSNLSNLPPEEQKRVLGEQLFPMVSNLYENEAGKITGMLLELDNADVLELIENPSALQERVEEAMNVLREHAEQEQQTQQEE